MEKQYDVIIIGFGKAGKTLAGMLAGQNKKVALIEKSKDMYGGTCINVGCIPSKSLVNSADHSYVLQQNGANTKMLYQKAVQEKNRVTSMLRDKNYHKLADHENITIIDGRAEFTADHTIQVITEKGTDVLRAEQIFINTGSVSVIAPIDGLKDNPIVYTSETLMNLETLPEELVIIGGGYISLEFASMYKKFGAQVTVVQRDREFLPKEDEDIAEAILSALKEQGIRFCLDAQDIRVDRNKVNFGQNGTQTELSADAILVATGRRPNTDGLAAEKAGIDTGKRGEIKVDEYLRTSVPGIFAMGDVTGGSQFTYASLDDFRIIRDQLLGKTDGYNRNKRKNLPYSVFMALPYARVGMNEKEAMAAELSYRVLKMPAAAIPKAQVLNKTKGILKAVVEEKTGKVLGVMLLCEEAYEMINSVKTAMDFDVKAEYFKNQIYTHPTMTEALNDLFSL